ncbi:hypothetical protein GO755_29400 [Spirosoma sp. HMF4905]|uniref:Peptidase C45 hydrolase domain-containing protein n=1 Tax=Spirosoma arboris TaxID=2682092 RepID=A0A7K1SKA1_9BACT|nr:C45 family peptidase [Spirosoma arboris]MVM34184.1 hypothetical protein [Spirosoma arboris]
MKTLVACLLLLASLPLVNQAQSAKRAEIREIQLSGSGYELGLQHGKVLKKEIAELVAKMKANTTRVLGKEANQVINEFIQYAQFTDAIKQYTPDLYEEVKGIADGSEQALNDIMVFNLLDEFWVYQDNLANHHCSGVGVPASNGNPAYIAQNMDIESYTDGYQILIRLSKTPTRPEQFILTHPGCIALAGMNETGVGACMNTLMQLKASSKGLPVAFIVRRILASTDKKDLLNFIQTVPHASGQNYIIGIKDEVYDFEASANKVVRFDPKNANGTIYHTNHPLVNDDVKDWFKKPSLAPEKSNSHIRLASVQNRVMRSPIVNDGLIKEALRAKDDKNNPVCRAPKNGGFTFVSMIMTLTGTPFLQVTAGPPDESEYKRAEFSNRAMSAKNR